MAAEYPVHVVTREQRAKSEPMGSKEKFWVRRSDGTEWLFKFPAVGTGGHWAEKIAYEVARRLEIRAAKVELATCTDAEGKVLQGSISRSFTMEYELYHGNQVLTSQDPSYVAERKYRQSQHTVGRIMDGMKIFHTPNFADECRTQFAGYLVLDALIGNVDRHHENWGVLRKRTNGEWLDRLAPTFDHASSLGRELRDSGAKKSRERYLSELGLDHYARHASGAVFLTESDARGPSPLEVVRGCLAHPVYHAFFDDVCRRVASAPTSSISSRAIERVPSGWMTCTARQFAIGLLQHNHRQLREMVE